MSLDNFQLPSVLLPELYKNSLVVLDSSQIKTDSLKAEKLLFSGRFSKRILLLTKEPVSRDSNPEVFAFLMSVLQACQLNLDDVALMDITAINKKNIDDITSELNYESLISFGVSSKSLEADFNENPYEILSIENRKYLFADPLSEIAQNNTMKKSLWNSLKSIFSIA